MPIPFNHTYKYVAVVVRSHSPETMMSHMFHIGAQYLYVGGNDQ